MQTLTPDSWRKVRVDPGTNKKRWSVRLFYTHLAIGDAAKKILGLSVQTENLPLHAALKVGQQFEDALRKLEEAAAATRKKR